MTCTVAGEHASHPHTRLIDSANKLRLISLQNAKVSFLAEIRLDRSSWTVELDQDVAFHDDRRPASCRSARYRHVDMWIGGQVDRWTGGQTEVGVPERSRIIV